MKSKFFKIGAGLFTLVLLVTTSCSKEETETIEEVNQSQLPKDVLNKVNDLNLNPDRIDVRKVNFPDGRTKEVIIAANDMAMDKDRFLQIPSDNDGFSKQYQTEFIIDTDVFDVVNLYVFTGDDPAGYGLSEGAQQGVRDAVENWNSVNGSALKLEADFGTSPTFDEEFYEILIVVDPESDGFGGFADFPGEEGRPGEYAVISTGANQFASDFPDAIEHLLTHEIGHAIGFRHTDWNSRQTCVDLNIEPEPSVEENPPARIFGTLPSIPGLIDQEDSIMNACFALDLVDGELNFFDEIGLRNLYPAF